MMSLASFWFASPRKRNDCDVFTQIDTFHDGSKMFFFFEK